MDKKVAIPVRPPLQQYLTHHGREVTLPVHYEDLDRFSQTITLYDHRGKTPCGRRSSTRNTNANTSRTDCATSTPCCVWTATPPPWNTSK